MKGSISALTTCASRVGGARTDRDLTHEQDHDPLPRLPDGKLKGQVRIDQARRERLAAELRANLRKRKDRTRPLAEADLAGPTKAADSEDDGVSSG
jgi:hypothetical protein